jgi:hypothetical protein
MSRAMRQLRRCETLAFGLGRPFQAAPSHASIAALALATGLSRAELAPLALTQCWPFQRGSRLYRGAREYEVAALPETLSRAFKFWHRAQQERRLGVPILRAAQ